MNPVRVVKIKRNFHDCGIVFVSPLRAEYQLFLACSHFDGPLVCIIVNLQGQVLVLLSNLSHRNLVCSNPGGAIALKCLVLCYWCTPLMRGWTEHWGGRVTLAWCRGCQRDYGNSQPPQSHPTVNTSQVIPSSLPLQPPPAALLITTPRMMNISTVTLPLWRYPFRVERADCVHERLFASIAWSQSRTAVCVRWSSGGSYFPAKFIFYLPCWLVSRFSNEETAVITAAL